MGIGEIVTLSITLIGLIVIGIFLLIKGGKLKLPKGKMYLKISYVECNETLITHFILSKKASLIRNEQALATRCCQANYAIRIAFKDKGMYNKNTFNKCKEIIVHLMDDDTYNNSKGEKWVKYLTKSAAYLTKCERNFWGKFSPMLCVRTNCEDGIRKDGGVITHELCHAYDNDYVADSQDHSNPNIWAAKGKENSAEYIARKIVSPLPT